MNRLNCLAVLFIALVVGCSAWGQSTEELVKAGNAAYGNRQYDSAIIHYEAALQTGQESAALYFNLGNARFKSGDLGRAIVNYLRAQRLDPSDDDILHNLDFARQFSTVQMEGVELNPISSFIQAIVGPYRLNTWAWWTSVAFVALFLLFILRFGLSFSNAIVRSGINVLVVVVVILGGLTTWKYRAEYVDLRGVVISDAATVYTGPSNNSDVELQAAPGLVVEILGQSGDYYNVLFANKRRGWMKSDQVETI